MLLKPENKPFDTSFQTEVIPTNSFGSTQDEFLMKIVSSCVSCDDAHTDQCDQVIYQKNKARKDLSLIPEELCYEDEPSEL